MNFNQNINLFIKHNKKYFKFKNYEKTNKKILIEFSRWSSLHVSSSYLLKVLQKKFKANIITYLGNLALTRPIKMNLIDKIKWNLGNLFSFRFLEYLNQWGQSFFFGQK